jgi:AraC-like DNA-binding protein/FixJ family two-component response regulator
MSKAVCKLLFADDEPWVIEGLKGLVDWHALSIELAPPAVDGEDALAKLESERPDILVTDINMPFIDGNQLIRRAKELYPGLQIIVLSGYSDFSFVRDALLHGAIDYVLKPVTRMALLDVVEKAMLSIGSARDKEREADDLRAKLLEASSILRDGEMSAAISDEPQAAGGGALLDLDLEFASFTLVLAKLAFRRGDARSWADVERLGGDVKSILASIARGSKTVAFRNLFARGEFVLVSDIDPARLERTLDELPGKLERRTGLKASAAVSSSYFSFDRLRDAYQEARAALSCRSLGGSGSISMPGRGHAPELRRRITPELENRLAFALESRNKHLARELIFDEIGLRGCEASGWLLIEAKQTAEYVAGMIYHRADLGPAAPLRSRLAMDNLGDLVGMALEEENVTEACSVLEQLLDEAFGEGAPSGASDGMIAAARRAQDCIDAHYFEDISLTSVAEMLGVDRAYLSKAFKQVTGCNIMLAIAKKRIAKAQECVMRGDLSLTDIADLVGYGDYAYFNRVFRKVAGMSPSEYKTSLHGGSS